MRKFPYIIQRNIAIDAPESTATDQTSSASGEAPKDDFGKWNMTFGDDEEAAPVAETPAEASATDAPADELKLDDSDKLASEAPPAEAPAAEPEKTRDEVLAQQFQDLKALEENKDKTEDELKDIFQKQIEDDLNKPIELSLESDKPADITESEDTTWTAVAEKLGFEKPEEDSFEAFQESITKQQAAKIESIKQEYSVYDTLSERSKDLVHFLEERGEAALQNFVNPSNELDTYIRMDNESLIEENFKAFTDDQGNRLYSDDAIADKMARMMEDEGKMQDEADVIRQDLHQRKREIQSEMLYVTKQEQARQQELQRTDIERTASKLKASLDGMNEFMDASVTPEIKDFVQKQWESGAIKNLLEDPKAIAEFFLFHKFGAQSLAAVKNREFEKGRNKGFANLYNIPAMNGGKVSAGQASDAGKTGGFSDWKAVKSVVGS